MRRGLRDGQVAGAEPLSNTQVKEIQRWLEEKGCAGDLRAVQATMTKGG